MPATATSEALARRHFRAVLAASDELALGCMAAAADRGLAMPDDMAFVGFGGLGWGMFTRPAMTTVRSTSMRSPARSANLQGPDSGARPAAPRHATKLVAPVSERSKPC